MNFALVFTTNVVRKAYRFLFPSRKFCNGNFNGDEAISVGSRVLEALLHQEEDSVFDAKSSPLDELNVRVSSLLVRDVLVRILRNLRCDDDNNKTRCAKLAYRFFVWSREQERFRHTVDSYHLLMKIFAECGEYKAMWRLVDEMVQDGYPTTARTFNLLICSCGEAGLAKQAVVQFIKSKAFNYRPFKHSYNAILNALLGVKQYGLIEWVYEQMLEDGFRPDVVTYNVLMWSNYRLGKMDRFDRLFDEMARDGLSPDLYTFNILMHILGRGNKPLAALTTLNHMKEVGIEPSVIHFTTLIDGLSRAGNVEACKYFLDEMVRVGCTPDVVCYTVMITGYVVSGDLEKAKEMFSEMTVKGQLPNVFTYNAMIRGLCMAGEFREACWMLKEMESRGCSPNFVVYSTLVSYLRKAGKLGEARKVIRDMVKKGHYVHLVPKMMKYRR
ncbi:pentatricopeptide repeat-containing protein At3g60050 [Brassica rapa]|uniref:Pentacotripeptide-repeat region of PRORP domain-containing protein n=1 Tax=Brassica campestris TaxID=3711 RepID=M4DDE8_BRACM|nr:pentatricopeptide repeat-containing protein At3g60050 [Brassica rapa]XP_009138883.1 pentatricopeptide repeat-containing protein At3g60050 [Brassica rapa]